MDIKTKILVPAITLTLFVAFSILGSNILLFMDFADQSTAGRVSVAAEVADNNLEFLKAKANAVSLSIAENRAVIDALVNGRREDLLTHARRMSDKTGVEFCVITGPDGRVLARVHDPETYGDIVTSRADIQSALAGQNLTVIEKGSVVRLSVRSGSPVFDDNRTVAGVVSVGYRLDTAEFVDSIKSMLGCEATVFLGDERISTTILGSDGARVIGTKADAAISETVLAGNAYTGKADILGRSVIASYTPIPDSGGRTLGMLFVGFYVDEEARIVRDFIRNGFIITLTVLAVSVAVILFVVRRIAAPIRAMTRAALTLASGDTGIDVRVKDTTDEIRAFAGAFGSMVENTRRQIEIIEQIAGGGLTVTPETRSEKDVINRALEKLNVTIKAHAAAIREEYERVRIMLDATPLASRLWDRNCKLLGCNEAAVKLFMMKNKQEYLDRYFELSPEYQSGGERTVDKIRRVVGEAFEKGLCTCEWTYRLPDGTPFPCETTMVRVPYGNDYAVAAYSRDLREQKKMIAEIENRDNLLQTMNQAAAVLLRSEPDNFADILRDCMGMMARAINADCMYLFRNHIEAGKLYGSQIFEWSPGFQSFRDNGVKLSISYSEQSPPVREALFRGECVHSLVRDLPPLDREQLGAQGILAIMTVPVFIQNEFWGFVGYDNCHSEQLFSGNEESIVRSGSLLIVNALLRNESMLRIRDTSVKLEAALSDAKEANNAKSNFLAHMSHEIRTPLNAIIGFSELILDEENLGREIEASLEKIYHAGSTILSIVNDILDISKIEFGKFEVYPVQYDTPSLINDTAILNVVRIGEKPISFKLYVDENLPNILFGDDLRVKQIFNNLLSNAFKYTSSGTVEWRVTFEKDGDNVWIVSSVRDTGVGIKPEDINKLFSDYNQVDTKANRSVEGTGLGLAITGRLVKMMDGTITVESEFGKGSVFKVRLRQTLVSDIPIGKEVAGNLMNMRYTLEKRAGKTSQGRINLSYARVLVVDDVVTNLDVVKGMLKPYKIKIDCATGGAQAIEMIRLESPRYNAVFMDHMMPGMDGIEAARIIREEIGTDYARNIPIIALTANAIIGSDEMFLRHGFQGFVSKPIDMAKLDAALHMWVRDKTLEENLPAVDENGLSGNKDSPAAGENFPPGGLAINGVDTFRALSRFGGNEKIVIDVLRSYAANTPKLLDSLSGYLAAGNFEEYRIVVHGIKGASYGIFARETAAAAEALEMAAEARDFEAVKTGHPAFEKNARVLIGEIDKALGEIELSADKPLAAAPDPALLEELRLASERFDMDGVDRAMARLESPLYENGGNLVAWLREQVNNMTFEIISGGEWPEEN